LNICINKIKNLKNKICLVIKNKAFNKKGSKYYWENRYRGGGIQVLVLIIDLQNLKLM